MTHREQIIFDALLRESDNLKKINPLDVSIIKVGEGDIEVWWKDHRDNFKMKLAKVMIRPSVKDFIYKSIQEYREKSINQLIN